MIASLIFCVVLLAGAGLFARNVGRIRRNIRLGRPAGPFDRRGERWKTMLKVALGQSKMGRRPVAGFFHFIIYAGFLIINIEVLEIILDGIFGTHRILAGPLGGLYGILIASFEILALGVILACVIFLSRRNILKLPRFRGVEMRPWPRSDANIILFAEILLMAAFLTMNAADLGLQRSGHPAYPAAGAFPVSSLLLPLLPASPDSLIFIERFSWWFHITGILVFLNYIPYSKHFHIFLAFPNTWYSKLQPLGRFSNMDSVTREVKAFLDPSFAAPAATGEPFPPGSDASSSSGHTTASSGEPASSATDEPAPPAADLAPSTFGARDIWDLSRVNLLNAYSCTECGRCTAACPANITGKLLSPRKIMMDTRDRIEEVGRLIDRHGKDYRDNKSLLHDYISEEELWACTTCNACVEVCPVNIDPLEIIMDLRRALVMEESRAPASWNSMFSNMENNGAPWQFAQADRLKWTKP